MIGLGRFCAMQWRENPLLQFVARATKKWFFIACAVLGLALVGWRIPYLPELVRDIILVVMVLLAFGLRFVAPIFYVRWAYNRTWVRAEHLQAIPASWDERMAAIVLPFAVATALTQLPIGVLDVFDSVRANWGRVGVAQMEPVVAAGTFVGAVLESFGKFAMMVSLATSVAVRALVTRRVVGAPGGRGIAWLLVPPLATFGVYLIVMIPLSFTILEWRFRAPGSFGELYALNEIASGMASLAAAAGTTALLMAILRADMALARKIIFQ